MARLVPAISLGAGRETLSRRTFLAAVSASALISPFGLRAARAQAVWREYRRDDLGFRIEFPGEPRIRVERARNPEAPWITSTDAQARYQSEIFDLSWTEFKGPASAEAEYDRFRDMMKGAGYERVDETPVTVSDVPAREFIIETGAINFVRRILAVRNLAIAIHAIGGRNLHNTPTVVRFMESFRLLNG
jgi:hypothetical protein